MIKINDERCSKDGFLRNFDDEKDDEGADYHTVVSTIENPWLV